MARKRRGRGEGGVFQRADGRWTAEVSLGYDERGRRRRKTLYGKTKAEVMAKLGELGHAARQGPIPATGGMTVGQLLDTWLTATRNDSAVRTAEERERLIRKHLRPHLGRVKLTDLSKLHVSSLYADLRSSGVGAATIRAAADVLAIALNYAVKMDLIRANPASAAAVAKPKVPKREMVALTPEQSQALLDAARDKPIYPMLAVALGSGCRQGELLALGWDDVDLRKGTVRVKRSLSRTRNGFVLKEPKTESSRRTVTLPAFAVDALRSRRVEADAAGLLSAPVFSTRTGGHLDKKNVLRAFKAVVRAANAATSPDEPNRIPTGMRFHDCRHTVASILLSAGLSLRAVSRRLGHARPEMTLRVYAHCMPMDDLRLAAELERMLKPGENGCT